MCFRPATVQADKRCPACTTSNPIAATNCSACGTKLPDITEMPSAATPNVKMPGAFGDSGVAGGGFQPRIPDKPGASPSPPGKD